MIEKIIFKEEVYAEIIRSNVKVNQTTFYSDSSSSFQFGIVSHERGYEEMPHYHKIFDRKIVDCQQMLYVQFGKVEVIFYDMLKNKIASVIIEEGDSINILKGVHAIKMIEKSQCITVKQGPFTSSQEDKINV
jgi:hypothetical protein